MAIEFQAAITFEEILQAMEEKPDQKTDKDIIDLFCVVGDCMTQRAVTLDKAL